MRRLRPPAGKKSNDPARQIHRLRELIAALDRRVPHMGRTGEALIAREAAALRGNALQRIAELEV